MFLLFGLFFQVLHPGKYQSASSKKIIKIDYDKYCKPQNGTILGDFTDNNNNARYYCDDNTYQFVFKQCTFHDITMNAGRYSYLILSYQSDLTIEESIFTQIQVYARLISTEQENGKDYTFTFKSNQIQNLRFYEKKWGESLWTYDRHCVYSNFKNTIITNNDIELDNSLSNGARGIGFYLQYHSGCIFKGNTMKNCVNRDVTGGLFFNERGDKDKLQFSDCVFTNCIANDPSILLIKDIDSDITITNVTFEQTENSDKHSIIKITPAAFNGSHLIFDKCIFRDLKCNGYSCGGIGLWFVQDSTYSIQTIEFKGSTFERIINSNGEYGGGAISISNDQRNKFTQLIVDGCTFYDVHSEKGDGGAIYYYPDENKDFCSITVSNSKFERTYSQSTDVCGQAIYIGSTLSNDNFIKHCKFTDCCNELEEKYVIYFNVNYVEFSNNVVTFSDSTKKQGCVFSIKVLKHVYKNNIFSNARADGDLAAGIHERSTVTTSIFIMINNTFDNILGSSFGRCFMIDLKKTYEHNIKNNTIKNCPPGGALFQIRFVKVNEESFTIESFNFIGNSVDDSLHYYYQISPQVLVLEQDKSANFYDRNMLVFSNCYFENNYNPHKGGAISYGNSRFTAYTTTRFYKCKFVGNHAKEGGGAISIQLYDGCMIEECDFINNRADEKGSSSIDIQTVFRCKNSNLDGDLEMPSDVNPTVQILKCTFTENNEGKSSSCILIDSSSNAPVAINDTTFTNSRVQNNVIEIKSDVKSLITFNDKIEFTDSNGCGGISINSNGKTVISNTKFIQTSKSSALSITSSTDSDSISVDNCLFDSCLANGYSCFSLLTKTSSLTFENNTVQKITAKGCQNYIGLIDCNNKMSKLTFENITFLDNAASSLYGGGTGLMFNGITELLFNNCNFTNNCAIEDRSEKRQSQYLEHPYYNGDGGAIQIGHICQTNNIKVSFYKCEFNENKAQRHGGAIAVQTLNEVSMEICAFNKNIANYDFSSLASSSSKLLFEDHFYKKIDGRGGALYINPSYNHNCQTANEIMPKITLDNNDFYSNTAYDGYAIYIEGDDGTETIFDIKKNSFNDNVNESNVNEKNPNALYGAVIVTEIFTITNQSLDANYNPFNYYLTKKEVNKLLYVDHYGNPPTYEFTQSDYFPSNNFTYSNAFTESYSFSNSGVFSRSDFFSSSEQFRKSMTFSNSNDFTVSDAFSQSMKFTNSRNFTESDAFAPSLRFSQSSYFSKSRPFISTNQFSSSQKFSGSDAFSQSETLLIPHTPTAAATKTPTAVITEKITEVITDTPTEVITDTPTEVITDIPTKVITETPTSVITEEKKVTDTQAVVIPGNPSVANKNTQNPTSNGNLPAKSSPPLNDDNIASSSAAHISSSGNESGDGSGGTSDFNKSNKKINISLILGIVIGLIALIVIILLIVIFIIRRKREKKTSDENTADEMVIVGGVSTDNTNAEFDNPLYNDVRLENDPFEQALDEDGIV